MDDEADAGRELERLRAELTEFVLDAVAARMASGEQPQLSKALVEAIDRRVDHAVGDRVAGARFPDPEDFADQVIAAAARRGGAGAGDSPRGRSGSTPAPRPPNKLIPFALGLLTGLGIAVVAWLVFSALQRPAPVQTNATPPVQNEVVTTSEGPLNVTVEGGNQAVPANQQAPQP